MLALNLLLPVSIMILSNMRIIYTLKRQKRQRYVLQALPQTISPPSNLFPSCHILSTIERQMVLIMLICVSVFLVTTVPLITVWILWQGSFIYDKNYWKDEKYDNQFIYRMLTSLLYLNYGINFYLYCLTSRLFRMEFIRILSCRKRTN